MTVQIYTGQDSLGTPQTSSHSHEQMALIQILKRCWSTFHQGEEFYTFAANVQKPSADLVVVSRYGIGIVELKHYSGKISVGGGDAWFAGNERIKSGCYSNPHQQVYDYASRIRHTLLNPSGAIPFLPGKPFEWETFRLNTAVCFTNPDAEIGGISASSRSGELKPRSAWERFQIVSLDGFVDWVAALRFGVEFQKGKVFAPHTLTNSMIQLIARSALGGTPWEEVQPLMPTGEPYGFLYLIDSGEEAFRYSLVSDEVHIGRDIDMDVSIPERFSTVSRNQACIEKQSDGIYFTDVGSRHGSTLNGQRVYKDKPKKLNHGDRIILGRQDTPGGQCELEFLLPGGVFAAHTAISTWG